MSDSLRKCFDWIGFRWRQPYICGESAWIPQDTMKTIVEARKGNQLSFFEQ